MPPTWPVGGRAVTFRPTVLEADPGRRLRWLGHLVAPGIFDGEHTFTIQPLGDGRVRLVQHEQFRGLLAPLMAMELIDACYRAAGFRPRPRMQPPNGLTATRPETPPSR